MTAPFDGGAADSGALSREAALFIGAAVHKAIIAVGEKGTEAAAATALAMPTSGGTPNSKEMTMDRPFIFAIQERETGAVLFLGRVTDPS